MANKRISDLITDTLVSTDVLPYCHPAGGQAYKATVTELVQTGMAAELKTNKTITAGGTTGAQTINKPSGTVNFAAGTSSLVVTNSLVTTASNIQATVGTNDATMKTVLCVAGSGSFTIYPNANPTAETRVNFLVVN